MPIRSRRTVLAGVAAVLVGLAGLGFVILNHDDAGMADQAQNVMPFDLSKTRHTFAKNDTGGVEMVIANDASDQHNIDLFRSHLRYAADVFGRGNFSFEKLNDGKSGPVRTHHGSK